MSEPFKPTWPAALYAAARPSYPTELIDEMLSAPSSSSTAAAGSSSSSSSSIPLNIVDLGAGTGICTRMLLDSCVRKQLPLSSVTALDASPSMLQQLEKDLFGSASSGSGSGSEPSQQAYVPSLKQAGKLPADTKTHCAEAKFETIDLAHLGIEGTVDLLVIAQAFHWCKDYDAAFAHFARIVRPGGIVALIWNLEDREAAQWVAKVRDVYEVYESGSPQYRHGWWRKMYDQPSYKAHFEALEPQHITRAIPTTVDGVCDRVDSKSYVSVQPDDVRAKLRQDIAAILDPVHSDDAALQRKWIDRERGVFEYPYRTDLFMFRRK